MKKYFIFLFIFLNSLPLIANPDDPDFIVRNNNYNFNVTNICFKGESVKKISNNFKKILYQKEFKEKQKFVLNSTQFRKEQLDEFKLPLSNNNTEDFVSLSSELFHSIDMEIKNEYFFIASYHNIGLPLLKRLTAVYMLSVKFIDAYKFYDKKI